MGDRPGFFTDPGFGSHGKFFFFLTDPATDRDSDPVFF